MPQFTVLKGGLRDFPQPTYSFVEAKVTDTRLMGVLGLMVHWIRKNEELGEEKHIHMFFYYDIEEIGLDSLSVYELYDKEAVALALRSCFGGLGALMYPVSEKEARYLICEFVNETKRKKQELPASVDYLGFILENPPLMTDKEKENLNLRMITALPTEFAVVNYYLMRGFGKDDEGVRLLQSKASKPADFEDISLKTHATFLKNSIELFYNNDGKVSYLSESLVESEGRHYIVVSEIKVAGSRVTLAKKKNCFEISIEEASMLLSRPEYCNVYKILCEADDFDIDFSPFSIGTTRTEHSCGDMYMEFKEDNNHVNMKEFRLYDDIQTLFFVSDCGELVVAAYTPEAMRYAEERIKNSSIMADTILLGKVQFARSVIYDFAESGFASFGEFIRSLE